ncbi:MAG: hypothetical protein EB078_03195 [Proteobacteria bacterium]|nr:hypothetical protein [Pseudomonadota bacterium]NDG19274.1 hypothetical protein [Betaproteobacteria bacterium]
MTCEQIMPVEPQYMAVYQEYCRRGEEIASRSKCAIVSIARNAMPHLEKTLALVERTAMMFQAATYYVYENDSTDSTPLVLDEFAASRPWMTVEHETLGEPDTRGFEEGRTVRLARCRSRCQSWVERHANDATFVLVLDVDPHGGFSPTGILNSVGWMASHGDAAGMASYSLFVRRDEMGQTSIAHYDAWAARLNFWEDRRDCPGGMLWAHMMMPPVGSPPIPLYSAFGGACLYRASAFRRGVYDGIGVNGVPDCEHVSFHRSMRRHGWAMYLNPSSRYVAILPGGGEE